MSKFHATLVWPFFHIISHNQQGTYFTRHWNDDSNLAAHLETEGSMYRSALCCLVEHFNAPSKAWDSLEDSSLSHCDPPQGPCISAAVLHIIGVATDKTPTTSYPGKQNYSDRWLFCASTSSHMKHCTQGCSVGLFCQPGCHNSSAQPSVLLCSPYIKIHHLTQIHSHRVYISKKLAK